jgi:hypothetical protein
MLLSNQVSKRKQREKKRGTRSAMQQAMLHAEKEIQIQEEIATLVCLPWSQQTPLHDGENMLLGIELALFGPYRGLILWVAWIEPVSTNRIAQV